jgi:hypothetical protein
MTTNPKIYEAFEEEAKGIDVQDLMSQMMEQFNADKGYTPTVTDEIKIRKMLLAKKYIEREQGRLAHLKAAIVADWDEKIMNKGKEIEGINDFIESYLKHHNNGKKISLDVGTATLRRSAPKVKLDIEKKEEAVAFLKQHNVLESFQKPAELDSTLLQNSYVTQFNGLVIEETEKRIAEEKELAGKITKKREGELKLIVERELAPDYYSKLPDFMQYIPEEQKLSITMK